MSLKHHCSHEGSQSFRTEEGVDRIRSLNIPAFQPIVVRSSTMCTPGAAQAARSVALLTAQLWTLQSLPS